MVIIAVVTGSRYWSDYSAVINAIKFIGPSLIIDGGAKGLDTLSEMAAKELNINNITIMANWNEHKKAAGPIRNRKMLSIRPDVVMAFHNDLQNSRGTLDCVRAAIKIKIPIILFTTENDELFFEKYY